MKKEMQFSLIYFSNTTNSESFRINTRIRFFYDIRITFHVENLSIDGGICIVQCQYAKCLFS